MTVRYDRDDVRRLITVTVTEPSTFDEILGAIDRQAAERTWEYAMLYDFRAITTVMTAEQGHQMVARVRTAGAGRLRGPVGVAVAPRPEAFRAGLMYSQLAAGLSDVEVLLTAEQRHGWLMRHGRGTSPPPSR